MALSVLYAALTLLGYVFKNYGGLDYLRNSRGDQLGMLAAFIVLAAFYYIVILYLFRYIDSRANRGERINDDKLPAVRKWISAHNFLFSLIVILVCWLPYLLIQYPGNVSWDGLSQLYQFVGEIEKTNRWPYMSTMFFGALFTFGRSLVNDNFGIFCIIIVQYAACAFIFSAIASYVYLIGKRLRYYFAAIGFYTIYPVFPQYAVTVIKETMYVALFALFILMIAKTLAEKSPTRARVIGLACAGLGLCFFRSEGVFVVAIAFLILFFVIKPARLPLGLSLVSILAVLLVIGNLFLPGIGVRTIAGVSSESMSLPFQQTARYIREFGDEVTEAERPVIEETLAAEDYRDLGNSYSPEQANPIKKGVREITNISEYIKVWRQMFMKHPMVYVQATINGAYGYFTPFEYIGIRDYYYNYIDSTANDEIPPESRLDIYYTADVEWGGRDAVRKAGLIKYMHAWIDLPIVNATVSSMGFYTWALLFLLAFTLRKRAFRACAVFAAPLAILAICVASPVNGSFRYIFPIIACIPVLFAFCLHSGKHSGKPEAF